ncbi:hypothetical protein JGS39_24100 [Streptomyces sp. P01-B04]|uniref:hypothetical protein n=1 Tax=Streptomyces poriferorum TaxID=2798799 RepID=UPI001C5D5126|nr:hypothetical protein [Streptomyces poriferorum]MBW5252045.1 hypothetical protein [Streptomyces poriferorum]MBW5260215.1 hypothetical protein [Streptomyces poriferorum]
MSLKPEISIGAGLAVGTLVYSMYSNATPTTSDIRSLVENNEDVNRAERSTSWMAAGVVAGISLIARDPVIFTVGGVMVIGMAWMTRHANAVNPDLKRFVPGGATQSEPEPEMSTEQYTAFENQFAAA